MTAPVQPQFLNGTLFLYSLCVFIWGSTWYAVKLQMVGIAPELSVAYRFAFASTVLFALNLLKKRSLKFSVEIHLYLALIGFTAYCISYLCSYWAVEHVTSGLVSVFYCLIPFFNALNARFILKQPMESRLVLASVLGVSGIGLIFWNEISTLRTAEGVLGGLIFSILGAYCSALANTLVVKVSTKKIPILQANAFSMGYSALFTFLYCAIAGKFLPPSDWIALGNFQYFSSFTFLVIFGSVISFGAYYTLQNRIGTTRASYMTVLFPLIALMYSTFLEGYRWTWLAFLGVGSVLLGLVLAIKRPPVG